jgi:zinc protease
LITATLDEIQKIKKDGPSAADLDKVKETWKQQHEVNLKENNFWGRQLLHTVEVGLDPLILLTYSTRISAITPEEVKAAAIKYLDMKNYSQFILNPENNN